MGNRDSNRTGDEGRDLGAANCHEVVDAHHDLGVAPVSWRGHIPRAFPHGPRLLNIGIASVAVAYAAFVVGLVLMPTQALGDIGPHQTYASVSQVRILVKTTGDENTRDVMRWLFLGRRHAVSECLTPGGGAKLVAAFEAGMVNVDAVQFPCLAKAMEPVRVPATLTGRHTVSLTKVLLQPVVRPDRQ